MRWLHVGAAQVQSRAGDVEGNTARMLRLVKAASCLQVDVLLFAETCVHAYNFSDENLALAEPVGGRITGLLSRWASTYGIAVLAGMIERDGECLYNSHVAAMPDGALYVQRKHAITAVEEAAGIKAGPRERAVFEVAGVKCAILICADMGMPGIHQQLDELGVEFVFVPTAGGGTPEEYMRSRALGTEAGRACYIADRKKVFLPDAILDAEQAPFMGMAAANALGYDGKRSMHRGHCVIVDADRVLRAQIAGTNVEEHFLDQFCHARLAFA